MGTAYKSSSRTEEMSLIVSQPTWIHLDAFPTWEAHHVELQGFQENQPHFLYLNLTLRGVVFLLSMQQMQDCLWEIIHRLLVCWRLKETSHIICVLKAANVSQLLPNQVNLNYNWLVAAFVLMRIYGGHLDKSNQTLFDLIRLDELI